MPLLTTETVTRRRNRNRILDATSELLSAGEKVAKLTINRIAETANLSRATFYLHFASKQDLIAALAEREIAPWTSTVAAVLGAAQVNRRQMEQVAQGLLEVYRAHQGTVTGIIEMAEYDDEIRRAWRQTIEGVSQQFSEAIVNWRPQLSADKAAQLARIIVWGGERFLHQEVGGASSGDNDLLVWTLTETAWRLMND